MASPHLLIIEARFYDDLADELLKGATQALERANASYERVSVPGCLEIPAALAMAHEASGKGGTRYDGFVLLGCVIRGETFHFDIVAGESARAVMDLAVTHRLAIGNGILTVEDDDQAWVRARVGDLNKGGAAAEAALAMIALRQKFPA
jgi:6,7-dimethyl-8-ribityllumazine synthase